MSELSQGRGWATAEFYQSNPRAAEIRRACVPILRNLHRLLYDPEIENDSEARARLESEIEVGNGALIELGIRPNMKTGKAARAYQSNPLLAAQYFAGQLLSLIGSDTHSMSTSTEDIGPGAHKLGHDIVMIDALDFAPGSRKAAARQDTFRTISGGFAIDDSMLDGSTSQGRL